MDYIVFALCVTSSTSLLTFTCTGVGIACLACWTDVFTSATTTIVTTAFSCTGWSAFADSNCWVTVKIYTHWFTVCIRGAFEFIGFTTAEVFIAGGAFSTIVLAGATTTIIATASSYTGGQAFAGIAIQVAQKIHTHLRTIGVGYAVIAIIATATMGKH